MKLHLSLYYKFELDSAPSQFPSLCPMPLSDTEIQIVFDWQRYIIGVGGHSAVLSNRAFALDADNHTGMLALFLGMAMCPPTPIDTVSLFLLSCACLSQLLRTPWLRPLLRVLMNVPEIHRVWPKIERENDWGCDRCALQLPTCPQMKIGGTGGSLKADDQPGNKVFKLFIFFLYVLQIIQQACPKCILVGFFLPMARPLH